MVYEYSDDRGGTITVEHSGEQTSLHIGSCSSGQQQSQGSSFTTGELSGAPELFRQGNDYLLRLPTRHGDKGIRVSGGRAHLLEQAPDTHGAEPLQLRQGGESQRMEPMKPMEGMKPMEPMKPMEMRMGNMHMSMGGRG